jgi:hypothetical protein
LSWFEPQQYASRVVVIAHVCRSPALIDANLTPG